MKNLKKSDIVTVLLCLALIIPGVLLYDKLPENVVTTWSPKNVVNGTSPKFVVVYFFPVLYAVVIFVCCLYLRLLNIKIQIGKAITLVKDVFLLIFYLVHGLLLMFALDKIKDVSFFVGIILALTFILLGNFMPKVRRNWIIGIRTSHVMSSDEIWFKTHRFAGVVMVIFGMGSFITTLLGLHMFTYVLLVIGVILPVVYGEVVYYRLRQTN